MARRAAFPSTWRDTHVPFNQVSPPGETLEVVTYWGDRIVEVQHSAAVVEADDEPVTLARVANDRTCIFLGPDMAARVRRGDKEKEYHGPGKIRMRHADLVLVRRGPFDYLFHHVVPPDPTLEKFADEDARWSVFGWAGILYGALVAMILSSASTPQLVPDEESDQRPWAFGFLPTPEPTPVKQEIRPPERKQEQPVPEKNPNGKRPDQTFGNTERPVPRHAARPNPPQSGGDNPKQTSGSRYATRENGPSAMGRNFEDLVNSLDRMGKVLKSDGPGAIPALTNRTGQGGNEPIRGNGPGFAGLVPQGSRTLGRPSLPGFGNEKTTFQDEKTGTPDGGSPFGRVEGSTRVDGPPAPGPAFESGLTAKEIETVIRSHLAEIRACYERNLQGQRALEGAVTARWIILRSGDVGEVRITKSTLNHPPTEMCISDAIKRWHFPLPRGASTVTVNHPFRLMKRN